jgi:hypothetical protein
MDQLARPSLDQRQDRGDRGVMRRAEHQCLHQRDPQRHARLCIVRQRSFGDRIDQRVEIRKPPEDFGGDGMRQSPVGPVDVTRRGDERLFQRLSPAQHGIEQAQRGAARGGAEGIGGIGGRIAIESGQTCLTCCGERYECLP